jgi:endonuclease/exonuclease/phosphatase family metal-dependent hydrolase
MRRLLLLFVCCAGMAPASATSLKLATWNLEWLIAPAVMRELRAHCVPDNIPIGGNERRIPCDVALRFNRSTTDFQALARYANELNADVIALQEVDGSSAASLIFNGYDFCFTARRHVQNNGFAIRKGLPHRCEPDFTTLSLKDAVRRGAEVTLFPNTAQEMRLLNVHLKSGCNRARLTSPKKPCRELARQAPALKAWIDTQTRRGKRFAVLGDFNRDLLKDAGPTRDLTNTATKQRFENCSPRGHYSSYIDYILVSRTLSYAVAPNSFGRVLYRAGDARHLKLSDHCPVSIRIER